MYNFKYYQYLPVFSTNVSPYNFPMAKIKIQEIMKLKDVKVRDLTESVPFSRATTYRILRGQKNPTIDDLEEFAKGLKVPLEDLYESEYSRDKIKKLSQH